MSDEQTYTKADLEKARQEGADNAKATYQEKIKEAKDEARSGVEKEVLSSIKSTIGIDSDVSSVDEFEKAWGRHLEAQGDLDNVKDSQEYKSLAGKLQSVTKEKQELEDALDSTKSDYENKLKQKDVNVALSSAYSNIQDEFTLNADDAISIFENKSSYKIDMQEGKPVVVDGDGIVELGGDGKPQDVSKVMSMFFSNRGYAKKDGAAGGGMSANGGGSKTITRQQFDSMGASERTKAVQDGAQIVD